MKKTWTAAEMGRKGGRISRRVLTAEQARAMVRARMEKRAAHKKAAGKCCQRLTESGNTL